MLESFLILLAGGVLLATAICNPREVTLHWLRLAGILSLSFAGIAAFVFFRRTESHSATSVVTIVALLLSICGQLAFAQVDKRNVQRAFASIAFLIAVAATMSISNRPTVWFAISCAGIAAACGIALMDMLLGHAYLTAQKMGIAPFRRLNLALAITLIVRAICSIVIAHFVNRRHPVDHLFGWWGVYIGTRWLVGLLVPGVFVYMAHDCIKRRSTQSATGILYVAGVLIFIGEITALHLARETGLPF